MIDLMKTEEEPADIIDVIEISLTAFTAINNSSELAKDTVTKDGKPIDKDGELKIVHSIAGATAEMIHEYLDSLATSEK